MYNVNLFNTENKDFKDGIERASKKPKASKRISVLNFNQDKASKFNKAMILYSLIHNKQNNIENKDQKEEKGQQTFYEDLGQYCNDKDAIYKAELLSFTEWFSKLDEGWIFTPLGINNIHIRVTPDNLGSLIGFALTSNVYFDGLVNFNYLNLKNKLLIQRESLKFNENITLLSKEDETDVFNSPLPPSLIEKELQKVNKDNFIITFWNYKNQEVKMFVELDGEKEEFTKTTNSVYWYKPVDTNESKEKEQSEVPPNHIKHFPEDYLKLDSNSPDIMLEFIGILSSESNKGTENLLKSLKKERDNWFETTADNIDYEVKIYFPMKFEALRRYYWGKHSQFINSIWATIDWNENSGGKSGSSFLQSNWQKYILKEVKKQEMKMFVEIEGMYFDYLAKSFFNHYPTTLAKILGAYRIKIKNRTKNESKIIYYFLQENLFVNPKSEKQLIYDLKGSKRNRFAPLHKRVLLDNNFLLDFNSMPLTLDYAMKNIMNKWFINDSIFLSKWNIIDYSVLLIINEEDHSLRVGVIDYIQQYTLYKLLETRFKKVVGKDDPTIISPLEYKKRFLRAMNKYFIGLYEEKQAPKIKMLK